MIKFYDTNALLAMGEEAFKEKFYISDITLHELEHIKTSSTKDEEVKFRARKLTHLLDSYENMFEVIFDKADKYVIFEKLGFEPNNDFQIVHAAWTKREESIFVTDDLSCRNIAKYVYKIETTPSSSQLKEDYLGYKEIVLSDDELASFYNNLNNNVFNLLTNQYIIIKNNHSEIVDKYRWDGEKHCPVKKLIFDSEWFGKVKPYENDVYQQLLFDSLSNNKMTLINGAAGTGKSFVALAFLMSMLQKRKLDKIVIFTNTVAVKGAAKLGYYPGSRLEKLLDSQIGNMLSSKFGGMHGLERLVADEQIVLLPMSDIRGYDTTKMNCAVYITEAQNMDIELMRLALQRIGEDCICIIDGDFNSQVDLPLFNGNNNGMRRVSEIFKGQDFFGQITLKNIYRSKIAEIAQNM